MSIADREICYGCGACVSACPVNCIEMAMDDEGFFVPLIREKDCTRCGRCEQVCPALSSRPAVPPLQKVYYGWARDDALRQSSSSGGMFSILAERVLCKGGSVFGAAFDHASKYVAHANAASCGLDALRRSKYVQSSTGATFAEARHLLEIGRTVLYSGTPCQIDGLLMYLGKDYPALLTVDFVCHGVPSPGLLRDHLKRIERKAGGHVLEVTFREKIVGWHEMFLRVQLSNKREYIMPAHLDIFYRAFLDNLTLRRSCYSCAYSLVHPADITLADFWAVVRCRPEIDDNSGISLVFLNSEKGEALLEASKGKAMLFPIDWRDASYCLKDRNGSSSYDVARRDGFFDRYRTHGYDKTARALLFSRQMLVPRLKHLIRKAIGRA